MATSRTEFPPVRAFLFDMDGLLFNTEEIYTVCANIVLERHGRPPLPWSVKARMMSTPSSASSGPFHAWAQLPISREQWAKEVDEQQQLHFPDCKPLPGVEKLLSSLSDARNTDGEEIQIALASSSQKREFDLKASSPEAARVLSAFSEDRRILGDDPRVRSGKPAPDIYLLALRVINSSLGEGNREITPEECLVFEDSVPGAEAGRRAGMRVVWVPHPQLAAEFGGREKEVLAGRVGLVEIGDEWQLGEIDDGWAERLRSMGDFPYEKYGIKAS
ncbi:hypothetical protein GP486_004308 [Trichoglossum hirsutum]|uniref:Haloacid dehalogenase-like hydrolase n=1 Tax=Trichoglossum hirsutum TaxID=265104 RepID=A0A9P8LB30_9PEZI|nr:hypothetical protein GP486_004308 [Trichoglossum hirsutum]